MKTTLITLAALAMASVASADWTNITSIEVNNRYGDVYSVSTLTFDFLIEDADLTSGSTVLAYVNGGASNGNNTQLSFTLTKVDDTYTLQAGRTNNTLDATAMNWSANSGDYATYTGLTAGTTYTVTAVPVSYDENWLTISLSPDANHPNDAAPDCDNQFVFASGVSTPTAKLNSSFSAAPVPEPATATLSLLALAGLAARRRRK